MAASFLGSVITRLDARFSSLSQACENESDLHHQLCKGSVDQSDAVNTYQADGHSPHLVYEELHGWKVKWEAVPRDQRPKTETETNQTL